MTEAKKIKLYLTGPKAGKTCVLGKGLAQAVKGVIEVDSTHVGVIKQLKKFYAVSVTKPVAEKPAS